MPAERVKRWLFERLRMEREKRKRKDVCGVGGKERILIEMARQEWVGTGGAGGGGGRGCLGVLVLASPLLLGVRGIGEIHWIHGKLS